MSIYAISDLHLSFGTNKPMDIFGQNWEEHYEKIKED
jgi:predicted phosphohydrolase